MKSAFQFLASHRLPKFAVGVCLSLLAGGLFLQIPLQWKRLLGGKAMPAGMANARNFEAGYHEWRAAYERNGGARYLVLALGWSKALSAEFTRATGRATFDLLDKSVAIEVNAWPGENAADVWLIDNHEGRGGSVMPEPGDAMVRLGRMEMKSGTGRLQTELDRETFAGFNLDLVVVARADQDPGTGGMLFGAPSLFQRLYRSAQNNPSGIPVYPMAQRSAVQAGLGFGLFETFSPDAGSSNLSELIEEGAEIFFNEKFAGNGRTCGTCHRLENNFTIDPKFIATLPPEDPLFVAEFTPALNAAQNGGLVFENPALMRAAGLIVENVDGFDDLKNKFVLRGVPHVLALNLSLAPSDEDGTTQPPFQRTGWSGDGAPGGGTLREFAAGAVVQHFTKTLNRQAGVDFRLPTDHELDALEAYQLSLGRPNERVLILSLFKNIDVIAGQGLFLGNGKCNICHFNAGANALLTDDNRNFNTGVEEAPNPFAALGPFPRDGGFGQTPNGDGKGGFGDGTFNTPSIIEAGDTEPSFHNNIAAELDSAVAFYSSAAFNNSPGGQFVGGINLTERENFQVTAFLYVLNVLENIRSANALLFKSILTSNSGQAGQLLGIAMAEAEDAIESMRDAEVQAGVVEVLQEGRARIESARAARSRFARIIEIGKALSKLEQAESSLIFFGPGKPAENAEPETAPSTYTLFQNHPNPFNPSTEIRFQLPEAGHVVIRIFNALGQEVRRLEDRTYEAGVHSVRWDGKDGLGKGVASGIYLYQLQAGGFSEVKKMSLLQ